MPQLGTLSQGAWQKATAQYEPGGAFGKGVEASLERGRTKALSSGMQSLVSSGLAGTTMAAGLGKKYEEEVAAPTRARVESERAKVMSQLQARIAEAQEGARQGALNRAAQMSMARLSAGTQRYVSSGRGVSTPGLDVFGQPMRGSLQAQQLDIQRRQLALGERGGAGAAAGGVSTYGKDRYSAISGAGGGPREYGGGDKGPWYHMGAKYTDYSKYMKAKYPGWKPKAPVEAEFQAPVEAPLTPLPTGMEPYSETGFSGGRHYA